jgi:predicted GIY-YIG superfamily endonuclease
MTCYLIHLDQKLGSSHPNGGAQHYLGTSQDVEQRLITHREGRGARILAAAVERGIGFDVVRTWDGGRELEKKLKAFHNAPRMCPRCS